jgi:hypothetical protein
MIIPCAFAPLISSSLEQRNFNTQGRGRLKQRPVSDLYADTKEMRPVSLHEADRSSEEPN